jgi:hypothetical protein
MAGAGGTATSGERQPEKLSVGLKGTIGLGGYLVVATLVTAGALWRTVPDCDAPPVSTAPAETAPATPAPAEPAPVAGGELPAQTTLKITAIEPASASVTGGTTVTISGDGFTRATRVRFGGTPARTLEVDGTRFITATTPAHAAGPVGILVTDAQSSAFLDGRFSFVCPAPTDSTLVLMVVLAGALGGLVHALRSFFWYVGQRELVWNWAPMYVLLPFSSAALGFVFYLVIRAGLYQPTGGTSYLLIGLAALVGMFSAQAAEKLKAIAEGIFSQAPQGRDSAPATKEEPLPAITAATPARGQLAGGETITIAGTGFTGKPAVRFGQVPATNITVVGPTVLTAVAPAGNGEGPVDIGIGVAGKPEVVKAAAYTYVSPRGRIATLTPAEGPVVGGTSVTIDGDNLADDASVTFGDQTAAKTAQDGQTAITVTAPPRTQPGPVDVRVTLGAELVAVKPQGFLYKA